MRELLPMERAVPHRRRHRHPVQASRAGRGGPCETFHIVAVRGVLRQRPGEGEGGKGEGRRAKGARDGTVRMPPSPFAFPPSPLAFPPSPIQRYLNAPNMFITKP